MDLNNLELLVVPHSIGKLKHLRYLNLSRNGIKILPNSITMMLNLQTLILQDCDSLIELPKGIKKLVNLRFLDITGCSYKMINMPLEIEHLTYLKTIRPGVVVTRGRIQWQSQDFSLGGARLKNNTKNKINLKILIDQ